MRLTVNDIRLTWESQVVLSLSPINRLYVPLTPINIKQKQKLNHGWMTRSAHPARAQDIVHSGSHFFTPDGSRLNGNAGLAT